MRSVRSSVLTVSEPLELYPDVGSNVALPLFIPGDNYQFVGFDRQGRLNLQTYIDDTVTPPVGLSTPKNLYRWYICESFNEGYVYKTLNWVYGKFPPENPSCVKTEVVRTFL